MKNSTPEMRLVSLVILKLDLRRREVHVLGFFFSNRKVSEREEIQNLS